QVTGTVSAEDGRPLSGASVNVQGTDIGSLTDSEGRFTLNNVQAGQQTVQARLIGYSPTSTVVTVAAGQTATANLTMATMAVELEGIVAVGYGTQEKVNITGSVAAVSVGELEKKPVTSVTEALQGVAPGLTVIDRGGRPGDAS